MTLATAALALLASPGLVWEPLREPSVGGAMTALSFSPHEAGRTLVAGDMLGIGLSLDHGRSWKASVTPSVYEIADFTWHPIRAREVWAGSMSGPLRSQDGGATWSLSRKGMPETSGWSYTAPIEKVLFDPRDSKRLLAFGGSSRGWEAHTGAPLWGRVWESQNGGESWTPLSDVPWQGKVPEAGKGLNIRAALWSGSSLVVLAAGKGAMRSEDGGKTWKPSSQGLPHLEATRLAVHPRQPRTLWVSLSNAPRPGGGFLPGGVFRSEDGGQTWSPSSSGLNQQTSGDPNHSARYDALAVSASDPQVLVATDTSWSQGVIYLSRDGGRTWRPSATRQNLGVAGEDARTRQVYQPDLALYAGLSVTFAVIDPKDARRIFACGTESIVGTENGGASWADFSSVRSGRGGQEQGWRGRGYSGWCSQQIRFDPFQKGRSLLQALDAARGWLSEDGLQSWTYGKGFPQPWMGGRDAAWSKGGRAYAVYGQFGQFHGVGSSQDGGKSWTILAGKDHGLPEIGPGPEPSGVWVDPENANLVLAAIGGKLHRTTNGSRFAEVPGVEGAESFASWKGLVALSSSKGVYTSRTGQNWTFIGGPKPAKRLAFDSQGRLYATSRRGDRPGVWRWDRGAWTRLLDLNHAEGIAVSPGQAERLVATTVEDPYMDICPAEGIYVSSDGGKTWSLQNQGLAMLRGHVAAFDPFDPETVVFGSWGRGFFKAKWPKSLTLKGTRSYASTPEDRAFAGP